MTTLLSKPVLVAALLAASATVPASADATSKILFATKGPVVSGISYCYAVMSGRENIDRAAQKRGFATPTDARGAVYPTEKPRNKRRTWIRNYTGPNVGSPVKSEPRDISVTVRYRETKCEVEVSGVPKSYGPQVVPVTMQVFGKLDRSLKLDPARDFGKVLVAGKGPSWHGGLYFNNPKYSGGVNFDIWKAGFAYWSIDLVRSDILKKKYGG